MQMSNHSFCAGRVYNLAELGKITDPCPARRFLKALQVKPIGGIVTGDEILVAMERRAKALQSLPLPETMPRTRRTAPSRALGALDKQSILAIRKRRK